MFVSVRDRPQGRRRRSQTYGVNKAARSSKLSLLSAITTGSQKSRGSNGSSSTVTQESYSKTSSSSSKRSRSSKTSLQHDSRERKHHLARGAAERSVKEKSMSRESVDVFAFLVEDGQSEDVIDENDDSLQREVLASAGCDSDDDNIVQSTHSDSGISMGDSVGHIRLNSRVNIQLYPLSEEALHEKEVDEPHQDDPSCLRRMQWKWPEIPRPMYQHDLATQTARSPSPERMRVRLPLTPDSLDKDSFPSASSSSGYDLVAEKLALNEVPALFRSFKKVKFRLLLQLQDEILEMEQQLAVLDTADTQSRHYADGGSSPASRRLSWQWGQSDLPAHRLHILGRLSMKLEQYYQALSVSQKVRQMSSSPTPADIARFRTWLTEHDPLTLPESRFLDDDEDLILLTNTHGTPAVPPTPTTPDLLPLCVLTITLLPLLCFKVMTSVLNRMILLTLILAAGLGSLEKIKGPKTEQHRQWVLACFGVSFLAAIIY